MCIRDRYQRRVHGIFYLWRTMAIIKIALCFVMLSVAMAHQYWSDALVNEYYGKKFEKMLKLEKDSWKHNFFAISIKKFLGKDISKDKTWIEAEIANSKADNSVSSYYISLIGETLGIKVDLSKIESSCNTILSSSSEAMKMYHCGIILKNEKKTFQMKNFELKPSSKSLEIYYAYLIAILKNDKPEAEKILKKLISKAVEILPGTKQLYSQQKSSVALTADVLASIVRNKENVGEIFSEFCEFIHQSVYSVESLEELYYVLELIQVLKQVPIDIEFDNSQKNSVWNLNEIKLFIKNIKGDTITLDGPIKALLNSVSAYPLTISLQNRNCLLYTSPSPRDLSTSRMPSSA
eukprot:TRINITY_DN10390_c0_g1_i1.p1 TRINITY_DN10390_c0_g1~~TRINITY_DN10390_c0_g1_i1.p1  ORF type:complete len:350 (+),score=70.75 TRINITY_DN10390_c0_g1_i1:152-1201(+)